MPLLAQLPPTNPGIQQQLKDALSQLEETLEHEDPNLWLERLIEKLVVLLTAAPNKNSDQLMKFRSMLENREEHPFSEAMEPPEDFPFDILLGDIKPSDLPTSISRVLDCDYLSPCQDEEVWPVRGKIYGRNERLIMTLPVSWGDKCVNVHFILGTGAPCTYVAETVLNALGMAELQLLVERPKVNGIMLDLRVSDGQHYDGEVGGLRDNHFKGVNLLGMDFLYLADATLIVNMSGHFCEICRPLRV